MRILITLVATFLFLQDINSQFFISEIHYDNVSTDVGEFVEVYRQNPQGDLSALTLTLYNGSNGNSYNTLDFTQATSSNSTDDGVYYVFEISGIQNGSPDGMAISDANGLVEFISYEGSFMANNGPAAGQTSTDIGVSEGGSTASGTSMQNDGFGNWVTGVAESPGLENASNLPVEFSSFEAKREYSIVVLTWATASEINNDYFEIQRSLDGRNWEVIGKEAGEGTTYSRVDYTYTDNAPLPGNSYYRLRQVDFDGQYDFSKVIAVAMSTTRPRVSPTSSDYLITVNSGDKDISSVEVFTVNGQVMINKAGNGNLLNLDISGMPTGMYFVRITAGDETFVEKIFRK